MAEIPVESEPVDELEAPRSSPASLVAAVLVSTTALAALVYFSVSAPPASSAFVYVPPLTAATEPGVVGPTADRLVAPDEAPQPAGVDVPNLARMRVPLARRRARELGIRLVIRDAWGQAIERIYGPTYRIASQSVAAGTHVAPGALVRAVADGGPVLSGY